MDYKNDILIKLYKYNLITNKNKFNPRYLSILNKNFTLLNEIIQETNFLINPLMLERLYCILNNIKEVPICIECKNKVNYNNYDKKYNIYCSFECSKKSKIKFEKNKQTNLLRHGVENPFSNTQIQEKIKKTNLERYGSENLLKNEKIQEKIKKTNLERYGSENPFSNTQIQEKIKKTNLERYGSENPFSNTQIQEKIKKTNLGRYGSENLLKNEKIKEKIKKTNLEKYGFKSPLNNKQIQEKIKKTNLERYNIEYQLELKEIQEKIKKTNLERYGSENPFGCKEIQEKIKKTNLKRYGYKNYSQKHYSQDTFNKLNNPEWIKEQNNENKKTQNEIAYILNVDKKTINRYSKFYGIKLNRYQNNSLFEIQINEFIKTITNDEIINNSKEIISPLELDIYIPSKNIAIEPGGIYFHSTKFKNKNYHLIKYNICKENGIKLITIFSDEWEYRQEQVKNKLKYLLNKDDREKIFARKCKVIEINNELKYDFFFKNHIQGDGPGSISYGLEYNNEIIAAITFIKQKDNKFILNRYATSKHVIGGFSKLLTHFQRNNPWKEIITFADLRWSEGELYEKCGFSLDKVLPPDYMYINGDKREHKFGYRHKHLNNKLKDYNPTLTEKQNCENNGVLRVYDCGKKRYKLTK